MDADLIKIFGWFGLFSVGCISSTFLMLFISNKISKETKDKYVENLYNLYCRIYGRAVTWQLCMALGFASFIMWFCGLYIIAEYCALGFSIILLGGILGFVWCLFILG